MITYLIDGMCRGIFDSITEYEIDFTRSKEVHSISFWTFRVECFSWSQILFLHPQRDILEEFLAKVQFHYFVQEEIPTIVVQQDFFYEILRNIRE